MCTTSQDFFSFSGLVNFLPTGTKHHTKSSLKRDRFICLSVPGHSSPWQSRLQEPKAAYSQEPESDKCWAQCAFSSLQSKTPDGCSAQLQCVSLGHLMQLVLDRHAQRPSQCVSQVILDILTLINHKQQSHPQENIYPCFCVILIIVFSEGALHKLSHFQKRMHKFLQLSCNLPSCSLHQRVW